MGRGLKWFCSGLDVNVWSLAQKLCPDFPGSIFKDFGRFVFILDSFWRKIFDLRFLFSSPFSQSNMQIRSIHFLGCTECTIFTHTCKCCSNKKVFLLEPMIDRINLRLRHEFANKFHENIDETWNFLLWLMELDFGGTVLVCVYVYAEQKLWLKKKIHVKSLNTLNRTHFFLLLLNEGSIEIRLAYILYGTSSFFKSHFFLLSSPPFFFVKECQS